MTTPVTTTDVDGFSQLIKEHFDQAMKDEIERVYDIKVQEMVTEMQKRKDEIVAGLALTISRQVNYSWGEHQITIRVQKD